MPGECPCQVQIRSGGFAFAPHLEEGETLTIQRCALHGAAPTMLKALQRLLRERNCLCGTRLGDHTSDCAFARQDRLEAEGRAAKEGT